MAEKPGPEAQVREIRRRTRHRYSAEEKIRIVLEGLKGEESIPELCRARGDQSESLLRLEQGVPRGREEAALGGHEARGEQRRGGVAAAGERAAEAAGGGPVASQPGAKKSISGLGEDVPEEA